jgi:hypothetical protein
MLRIAVRGADGQFYSDDFLIDTGADRTVFSASFQQQRLRLPVVGSPLTTLAGIGGIGSFVVVNTELRLTTVDAQSLPVSGQYAVFTQPRATDHSILGRDFLDQIDLIVSRPRNEIRLLYGTHYYQVLIQ